MNNKKNLIKMPEADKLADLHLIDGDLDICIKFLDKLLQLPKNDPILETALWNSALVSYARCFGTGCRLRLKENILKDLLGEPLKVHKIFIDMRDKHVSHSVNSFEQAKIGVLTKDYPNGRKEVIGVVRISAKYTTPEKKGIINLKNLANKAREHTTKKIKEYENKVLELSKKVSLKKLSEAPKLKIIIPSSKDAGKAREIKR